MSEARPKIDPRQEIRFAVVLYGGVSLAIYINGVTQELFRMVRATAENLDEELKGSEKVYREIGQLLGQDEDLLEQYKNLSGRDEKEEWSKVAPVRARFVVDVLSGTSAGGINAVYLAKALANGQPIEEIQRLWIQEGDIERLINDGKSVEGLGFGAQSPPKSLLNGQRMYHKLFEAFGGMEKKKPSEKGKKSPYNKDLDLFVTATDLTGLPIYFRLSGGIAWEKRHRNVFHFRYSENERNDFLAENDRFLAFAARCTSAFPFAFEPMNLTDINEVLPNPLTKDELKEKWEKFFPDYLKVSSEPPPNGDNPPYFERDFGDGGYLDNKPFGYATEALASRRSGLPVRRKLLYVEPSPEEFKPRKPKNGDLRLNAIENVYKALSLARYETIREDMERILHRNRLNERARHIISGMERDLGFSHQKPQGSVSGDDYAAMGLEAMIRQRGVAYGGYHRLKVAEVTDEITTMIVNAAQLEIQSDEFLAVRYLVRAWREQEFVAHEESASQERPKASENLFLLKYDLSYRIRRLEFVLDRLAQLYCADDRTKELLSSYAKVAEAEERPIPYMADRKADGDEERYDREKEAFREELEYLRDGAPGTAGLGEILSSLRRAREEFNVVGSDNPIHKAVRETGLESKQLRKKIFEIKPADVNRENKSMDDRRLDAARTMLEDSEGERRKQFERLADKLAEEIAKHTDKATSDWGKLLEHQNSGGSPDPYFPDARAVVRHYYDIYDYYDSILFPLLQTTEEGAEFDSVEIARVSPVDSPSIFKEGTGGRRRLAGTALGNFGAFLDRGWRQNDMLWGRLDGAERIITTLLVGTGHEKKVEGLIKEAQCKIIEEEFKLEDGDKLCQLLVAAINATNQPEDMKEEKLWKLNEAKIRELVNESDPKNEHLVTALRERLDGDKLREFLGSEEYKVNGMDRKATTRSLARATTVIGRMLEGISVGYSDASKRMAAWITRFGLLSWGMVEVSVPRSLAREFFRYWLSLFYLFGALLIAVSVLLPISSQIWKLGLIFVGIAAVAHYGTWLLGRFLRGEHLALRLLKFTIAAALLSLLAVGFYAIYQEDVRAALVQDLPDVPQAVSQAESDLEQSTGISVSSPWTIALLSAFGLLALVGADRVFGLWLKLQGAYGRGRRMIGRGKRHWRRLKGWTKSRFEMVKEWRRQNIRSRSGKPR